MVTKDKLIKKVSKLENENRALKTTCEVLADKKTMNSIRTSLEQIKSGEFISLSEL